MLDIKFIRDNAAFVKQGAINKRIKCDIDRLLEVDAVLKPMIQEIESLQAERNKISKMIPKATPEQRSQLISQVNQAKERLSHLEQESTELKAEFDVLMLTVPAPARDDVPVGKDDSENVVIKHWGEVDTSKKGLDHVDIAEQQDWLDSERGVKLAGSRSYILKGELALLEQAVLRFTVDCLFHKGYQPMSIPVLVKESCMVGTGYFPTGRDQAYYVEKDELALVGTGEVSLTSYRSGEILDESELPLKFCAQSACFRREAGTYGKDTRGLYRVHQFQKVEQVIIAAADQELSEQLHDELVANAEQIMQALELPYRVVYVCTGDLGQGQVRKHDIEAWMPSRGAYSETHSCSTFHDFQARRLQMRYRDQKGGKQICYTLNNTAIASPRVLIPFLEVHCQKDGRVRVPEALQPYLFNREYLGKSR